MEQQPIQWFPGHMAKTRRLLKESMALVDMAVEVSDARIPQSSRNPELDELCAGKPRLLVLSKADMADEAATRLWVAYFHTLGQEVLALDGKRGKGVERIEPAMARLLTTQRAKWEQKGMVGRPMRAMVVGIPNTGKSTLINRLLGAGRAKAEDRPGVTRSNRWFTLPGGTQLLDTPGVLWPKFEDQQAARYLAFTGAIRDSILDGESLAGELLTLLSRRYPSALAERYRLPEPLPSTGEELLSAVAEKRGMRLPGGGTDIERAANTVLDDYRGGKLGKITLEYPPEREDIR